SNDDYEYNPFRPGELYITSEFKRPEDVATVEEVVSEYSRKALETFDGNKTRTAKALGISVNTLNKKLQFGE
ncbi:MAG: helix-turn-helix domain-containing protein, partial [Bacillota bacterium]